MTKGSKAGLPVAAATKFSSSRLVDALVPALVVIAMAGAATGWMNSQAVANGESPQGPAAAAAAVSVVKPAEAVRVAAAPPPVTAPVADPAPDATAERLLQIGNAAQATEAPPAAEPRAARKRVRSREASPNRRKLAERRPARPKVKYRYSENMRLFCQRAGAATPECRIFRRNTVRRRRA